MLTEFANQKIAVVGLGLSGRSCLQFLAKHNAHLHAFDTREHLSVDLPRGTELHLGKLDGHSLCQFDLIVLSPGLPLADPAIQVAIEHQVPVIGDVELFARLNHKPVIAITGSNGKSTVTSLCTDMLKASGVNAIMGGNIGIPVLELLEQDYDVAVLELSSFQLETTQSLQPLAATVLNVCEDHMDRYDSFDHYRNTKLTIYRHASHVLVNFDDKNTTGNGQQSTLSFASNNASADWCWDADMQVIKHQGQSLVDFTQCQLVGQHNVSNIQAAAALATLAGATVTGIQQAAYAYQGLAHRCQLVANKSGVRWVNDSKGTNIGATLAAISGLKPQIRGQFWLIAGGDGKGADFTQLSDGLAQVDKLICFGLDGDKIAALKADAVMVEDLQQAVSIAATGAKSEDWVLLSPACASLDMFVSYQERGNQFVEQVRALA